MEKREDRRWKEWRQEGGKAEGRWVKGREGGRRKSRFKEGEKKGGKKKWWIGGRRERRKSERGREEMEKVRRGQR